MEIPGQKITINDGGLGIVAPAATTPWLMGVAEKGTVTAPVSVTTTKDAIATWGQGPLTEAVCHVLEIAGGPVIGQRIAGSVAGASGAVTPTRVSTSTGTVVVTVGVALDAYDVQIVVLSTGGIGLGTFKYSLDGGLTVSEELVIPSGGTFAVPFTGLTVTFADGAGPINFEKGDVFAFSTTAPYYSTTNLAACFTALQATSLDFAFIVLIGKPPTASDGATMFAALSTHMTALETVFRYARAMMDAGQDSTENIITAYANAASTRVLPGYGDATMASSKPFTGRGSPKMSAIVPVAARAAESLISTRLGRFASGPLPAVTAISHDEQRTQVLDQNRFATLRTYLGAPGFYITNGRLKCPAGSDFEMWTYGRVMDVACATVRDGQMQFVNKGVRTTSSGSLNPKDAEVMRALVLARLNAVLTERDNVEGSRGHVSALDYRIDITNNIQATKTLVATVSIRPLGYAERIETTIGFAVNVGG